MPRSRLLALLAVLLGTTSPLGGCSTQRTLTIDSDPPNATVWIDGVERGPAPVTIPFTHYGWFEVRLERPGYQSLATEVEVPTRIDGIPIVDLPFELAVRSRHFRWLGRLQPNPAEATDADLRGILDEARAFRQRTLEEARPDGGPAARPPAPRPEATEIDE